MTNSSVNRSGQAVVEYLLVFLFVTFMAWWFFNNGGRYLDDSIGGLGYALSAELTTGVCERSCYFYDYVN